MVNIGRSVLGIFVFRVLVEVSQKQDVTFIKDVGDFKFIRGSFRIWALSTRDQSFVTD